MDSDGQTNGLMDFYISLMFWGLCPSQCFIMSPLLTSFPNNHRVSSLVSTICPQRATWALVRVFFFLFFHVWIGAGSPFEFYGAATGHQLWCARKNQVNYIHWLVHLKATQCRSTSCKSPASNKRNRPSHQSLDPLFLQDKSELGPWHDGGFTVFVFEGGKTWWCFMKDLFVVVLSGHVVATTQNTHGTSELCWSTSFHQWRWQMEAAIALDDFCLWL